VRLEKFEALEKRVGRLVEQFSSLKIEKDRITGVLKKKSMEDRETKKRLDKFHKERYQIRSRLDALIDKLESIEHM